MTPKRLRPAVFAVGYKGELFVKGLVQAGVRPIRIVSYKQLPDEGNAFQRMSELALSLGVDFEESRRPAIGSDQIVFLVGWQFLLEEGGLDRCVVFHDSLLPKSRGFAPTVTAILCGDELVGVTAIQPDAGLDTGAVYGSRAMRLAPGTAVQAVLESQVRGMVDLALEILQNAALGTLSATPQEEGSPSYSVWRDASDYFIDWRLSATEILRQVAALGFPYSGARAVLNHRHLVINRATLGPDFEFRIRDPGKLWKIDGTRALVICGTGTLWIEEVRDVDGILFKFKSLRSRFLTADSFWKAPYEGPLRPLEPIVFYGATRQTSVLSEFVEAAGYRLIAILSDVVPPSESAFAAPVIIGMPAIDDWITRNDVTKLRYAITDGDFARVERHLWLRKLGLRPANLIHPTSFVSSSAVIGDACQILAFAYVAAGVRLGDAVIVNARASLDVGCDVGNGVYVGPGVTIAEGARIGANSFIGAGVVVLPDLQIAPKTVIEGGVAVNFNVLTPGTYIGTSARGLTEDL